MSLLSILILTTSAMSLNESTNFVGHFREASFHFIDSIFSFHFLFVMSLSSALEFTCLFDCFLVFHVGIEPRTSCVPAECSTTDLLPRPFCSDSEYSFAVACFVFSQLSFVQVLRWKHRQLVLVFFLTYSFSAINSHLITAFLLVLSIFKFVISSIICDIQKCHV